MDYRTLFLTQIAFMTVYTVFACCLALQNRRITGFYLISWGLLVGLVKVIFQGLEGTIPVILSTMVANELYLVSFFLQMIGLRWFVSRTPLTIRWPLSLVVLVMAMYTALYVWRVPYIANVINIPVIIILGTTAWMLIRRGSGLFYSVSRWSAIFIIGQMLVSIYRAVLTNLHYALPWEVSTAQHDLRWLYSLIVMMLFATCVVMCDIWFFVTELQSELTAQATTDSLTGALNWRALHTEGSREIARTRRSGRALCVMLLDVDHFKEVNDTRGHSAGDVALRSLVEQVRGILRSQDVLARSGGEEFTVMLPETTCVHAQIVAERVRASIEATGFTHEGVRLGFSVSIGVAELDPSCKDFDTLLRNADKAMYKAKRLGRNRVVTYCPEPDDQGTLAASAS